MNEQLKREIVRLTEQKTYQDLTDIFKIYKEFLFKAIINHQNEANTSIQNQHARLVLQMMFSKIANIEKLVEGIEFTSSTGEYLNRIIDPILISSSIRGIFESVGMFSIIYVIPKIEDEKLILHTLWVLAGLNYRQKFNSVTRNQEYVEKSQAEKDQIDNLTKSIEDTTLFKSLTLSDKNKIYNAIKNKHYNIMFVNNTVKGLGGYQELIDNTGIRTDIMGQLYTYYSLRSHPSNVSVFQFGAMFNPENNEAFDNVNCDLKIAFYLISVFIADYIKVFPEVLYTLNNQSELDKLIIKLNNSIARGLSDVVY